MPGKWNFSKLLGAKEFTKVIDLSVGRFTRTLRINTIELREVARAEFAKWLMRMVFSGHREFHRPLSTTRKSQQQQQQQQPPNQQKKMKMPEDEAACEEGPPRYKKPMKKTWYPDPEYINQFKYIHVYPTKEDMKKKPNFSGKITIPQRKYITKFINFGPAHPSAHGALRLVLEMENETIVSVTPHIGFLHRGSEKLMEYKTYLQALPYFDRFDYVSVMACELAYVLAVEKLLGVDPPPRAKFIRTMFTELMRLTNHTIILAGAFLDCGAITPLFWMFEEREKLYEFCERASGSRMHTSYFRPGGVACDLPLGFLADLQLLISKFFERTDEVEDVMVANRIFRARNVGIGVITAAEALNSSCSGTMLRSTGVKWDLRKSQPYDAYSEMTFDVPVSVNGDCFDRCQIRLREMRESARMILQCINKMPPGEIKVDDFKLSPPKRLEMKTGMEDLIHHFKYYSQGFAVPPGATYTSVEAPKGEFGVYLVSDGTTRPYRVRVRSASFPHLALMDKMSRNHLLGDIPAILGSVDVVFGEVDR